MTTGQQPDSGGARTAPPISLLMGLSLLGPLSTHLIVPSLPNLQREFATDYGTAQLLISLFMIAFGATQIVVGALADAFGRRPMLLAGLLVFTIASVLCAFAPRIEVLIGLRVLQGASGCFGIVLARAIVRDMSSNERTASMLGYLAIGTSVGPMLAPITGGLLHDSFGWAGPFWFLAIYSGLALCLVSALVPETSRAAAGLNLRRLPADFGALLRRGVFLIHAANICLNTALFYSFVVGAAFVASEYLDLSPTEYGIWFSVVAIGYASGNFLSGRGQLGRDPKWSIFSGSVMVVFFTLLMLVLFEEFKSAGILFLPMAGATLASGFIMPNSLAGVLSADPTKAGSASGLIGFLQFATASAFSYIAGILVANGPRPMIVLMLAIAAGGALSAALLFFTPRQQTRA